MSCIYLYILLIIILISAFRTIRDKIDGCTSHFNYMLDYRNQELTKRIQSLENTIKDLTAMVIENSRQNKD